MFFRTFLLLSIISFFCITAYDGLSWRQKGGSGGIKGKPGAGSGTITSTTPAPDEQEPDEDGGSGTGGSGTGGSGTGGSGTGGSGTGGSGTGGGSNSQTSPSTPTTATTPTTPTTPTTSTTPTTTTSPSSSTGNSLTDTLNQILQTLSSLLQQGLSSVGSLLSNLLNSLANFIDNVATQLVGGSPQCQFIIRYFRQFYGQGSILEATGQVAKRLSNVLETYLRKNFRSISYSEYIGNDRRLKRL